MAQISIFKNINTVVHPENVDLIQYLEDTRDGKWEDIVMGYRIIKDEQEKADRKKSLPTATLSGTFFRREEIGIESHNGFISMDLDDVDNIEYFRRKFQQDKYVFSVFVSTSGNGLRVIFKIEPDKHREAFKGISEYIFSAYGLPSDPNGISLSKPYYVSFDPFLYINPDWENVPVFKKYVKEKPIKPIKDFVYTASDFDNIIRQINARRINICESYQDWLKVGFALADQFGESGREYFHQISQHSDKYNSSATDNQYKYCLKSNNSDKARISTIYYLAQCNGIKITSENTKIIVRATRNGKKAGLKKDQIIENLAKFNEIKDANKLVEQVFDSDDNSFSDEEYSVLPQLELFINNNFDFRWNEITGYIEDKGKKLSESDLNTVFISAKKLIPLIDFKLMMRLLKSDFLPTYNPFFEYFNSDGIAVHLPPSVDNKRNEGMESPLVDKLCSTIKNDNPAYTSYFIRKWLVGAISATHKVHSPLLLCLLGPQNSGKTEWFRRLPPKGLMDYYAESKLDKEKDDEILMTECWIIMDDELGGKSKQDYLKLKNITSKQYFSLRRPYGEHNEKLLRLAVLCGTSNDDMILSDPTGNRRVIPIDVDDIDKDLYNSIDKTALWKEVFDLYKQGFDWRLSPDDIKYLNRDKEKYEMVIMEREIIRKYYAREDVERLTTSEIKIDLEFLTQQRLNINSLGRELKSLGFDRKSTREEDGATPKKWCVRRINRNKDDNRVTNRDPF